MIYGLQHSGVKNMKWGVKHGPPYPLSKSISTGKSLKPQAIKSDNDSKAPAPKKKTKKELQAEYDEEYRNNKETDSDKRELLQYIATVGITAGATGVGIATIGPGSAIVLSLHAKRLAEAGLAKYKTELFREERAQNPIDKKTGFHKKTREMTEEEDLERVNPSYHNFDANTKNNCVLCTVAYDLRRRGYDVEAKTAVSGFYRDDIPRWYKNPRFTLVQNATPRNIFGKSSKQDVEACCDALIDRLKKDGDSRGMLSMTWNGTCSGHAVAYEVKNGSVRLLDGQDNKIYDDPYKLLKRTDGNFEIARLDNLEIRPKGIQRCAG